ncbi:MAG: hypothetical protein WCX71_03415 [Candidatus Buchananbacteria bacterium]
MDNHSQFTTFEPPAELLAKIMAKINQEKKIGLIKRKLFFSTVIFFGSITALVPIFSIFRSNLVESGFWHYVSLIFLDFDIIKTYWQDFGLTILETLPTLSLAAILSAFLVILTASRSITQQIQNLNQLTHQSLN